VAQKKKDGPTYGKRITKRGQQYKLGLDVVYVSGSKLVLNLLFGVGIACSSLLLF
jgi:hypothetical protein